MNNLNSKWPSKEEIEKVSLEGDNVNIAPFGVLTQYAEAVYEVYDKRLFGLVTAKFETKDNGDRTKFCYALYLNQAKEKSAQIKILEIDIQDDGWYPAKVFLVKPQRELIGSAETETQLRKFIDQAINSDFVKKQVKSLLTDKSI